MFLVSDKFPPEVEFCPEDIIIEDNEKQYHVVEWDDPTFTDDIGVVDIEQTHRSGTRLNSSPKLTFKQIALIFILCTCLSALFISMFLSIFRSDLWLW